VKAQFHGVPVGAADDVNTASTSAQRGAEPPEVEPVAARPEARRLNHIDRELELVAHPPGLVRIAAERDRPSPRLPPPAQQAGRDQRALGVHLEDPVAGGQGVQHGPVLGLERLLLVRPGRPRPHPPREVQVRQYLEQVTALDQPKQFGEVPAHHVGCGHLPEQVIGGPQPPLVRDGVQRAQDPVRPAGAGLGHGRGRAGRPQMGLADFDAGEDTQLGKALTAVVQGGEVAPDVEQVHPGVPVGIQAHRADLVTVGPGGEVQMVGEGHAGQAGRHCLLTAVHHGRLAWRVPRPFGVHVAIDRGRPSSAGLCVFGWLV